MKIADSSFEDVAGLTAPQCSRLRVSAKIFMAVVTKSLAAKAVEGLPASAARTTPPAIFQGDPSNFRVSCNDSNSISLSKNRRADHEYLL